MSNPLHETKRTLEEDLFHLENPIESFIQRIEIDSATDEISFGNLDEGDYSQVSIKRYGSFVLKSGSAKQILT